MNLLKCRMLGVQSNYMYVYNRSCICDRIWENPPYGIFRENGNRNIINSTTLELTLLQVLDRSRVPFQRYAAFCAMTRELLNSRNYGLKALLCARMRSPYTTSARTLAVGGAWRYIDHRSNETSKRMATKTARLRPSAVSFSRLLENNSCQPV